MPGGRRRNAVDSKGGPAAEFALRLRELQSAAGLNNTQLAAEAHYDVGTVSKALNGKKVPSWEITHEIVSVCGGDLKEWKGRWTTARAASPKTAITPGVDSDPDGDQGSDGRPEAPPALEEVQLEQPRARGVVAERGAPPTLVDPEFGPYLLLGLLGSGVMSEVWRARDTRTGGEVALKILRTDRNNDNFATRFQHECAQAHDLRSPHIVSIHDYGEIDGWLYLAMDLIEGIDLATLLRDGPLPPRDAVKIIIQITTALDAAHQHGVVHRDVTPSKILVSNQAGDYHAYLVDFGIARALEDTTADGAVIGTPAYMAPERFAGHGDHRSDLYALGCVLYETLTGHRPFPATELAVVMNAHLNLAPPRPSQERSDVPPEMDEVVACAMAKDPDQRFATAAGLAVAARQALLLAGTAPNGVAVVPVERAAAVLPGYGLWAESTDFDTREQYPAGLYRPIVVVGAPDPDAVIGRRPIISAPVTSAGRGDSQPGNKLLVVTLVILAVIGVWWFTTRSNTSSDTAADQTPTLTLTGHTDSVRSVTTALRDGHPVIISGSADKTIRVWDLATGAPIGQPISGHDKEVHEVTTGQLDRRTVIISTGNDLSVRLWDLFSGKSAGNPVTDPTNTMLTVTTAELDGRPVIISGGNGKAIEVTRLGTDDDVGRPLTGHTDTVWSVTTAQLDGRPVIISGSADKTIRVWDLATHAPIGAPIEGALTGHADTVWSVTTAQLDGRPVIISGSADKTIRVWDLATGAPIGQPLHGHTGDVFSVTTAQLDGRTVIISGSRDKTIRVWDLATGRPIGHPFTGHTNSVLSVTTAQLNERTVIISGSADRTIKVWDLATVTRP